MLEARLLKRAPDLWLRLHCVAYRLYEKWAKKYPQEILAGIEGLYAGVKATAKAYGMEYKKGKRGIGFMHSGYQSANVTGCSLPEMRGRPWDRPRIGRRKGGQQLRQGGQAPGRNPDHDDLMT